MVRLVRDRACEIVFFIDWRTSQFDIYIFHVFSARQRVSLNVFDFNILIWSQFLLRACFALTTHAGFGGDRDG